MKIIFKNQINHLIEYHKKRARKAERKQMREEIAEYKRKYETRLLIAEKNHEAKLSEYKAIIKRYKDREQALRTKEQKIIEDQIAISRDSSRLYYHLKLMGETIIKSAH